MEVTVHTPDPRDHVILRIKVKRNTNAVKKYWDWWVKAKWNGKEYEMKKGKAPTRTEAESLASKALLKLVQTGSCDDPPDAR